MSKIDFFSMLQNVTVFEPTTQKKNSETVGCKEKG